MQIMEFNDSVNDMLLAATKYKPQLKSALVQHFQQVGLFAPFRVFFINEVVSQGGGNILTKPKW